MMLAFLFQQSPSPSASAWCSPTGIGGDKEEQWFQRRLLLALNTRNVADLFSRAPYLWAMEQVRPMSERPDVAAAERGGDWGQRMDGEGAPEEATIRQALYWRQIYTEILAMEEKVLVRIRELMITQSDEIRREVELTNVPVVVAQAERFRQRLSYWEARVLLLGGDSRLEP